ncbi:unnamed protein product, partial [Symbiodinium microadriaticum]
MAPTANSTCLYVTLMDQFGDGWNDDTYLYYTYSGQVYRKSVACCSKLTACLTTTEGEANFRVIAVDPDTAEPIIPSYFWEVHWSVQIIDGGELNEKYYGGFNTSMTFSLSEGTYAMVEYDHLWKYPSDCINCLSLNGKDTVSLLEEVYFHNMSSSSVGYSMGSDRTGSSYENTAWYIVDAHDPTRLLGYGLRACGSGQESLCDLCLADGNYTYRSTGALDPNSTLMDWEFCGVEGGAQTAFQFSILNGTCTPTPDTYITALDTCPGVIPFEDVLKCVPVPGPDPLGFNDTCLYITIYDQFGDGWGNDTQLHYWSRIGDVDTAMVSSGLNCSCSMKAGCLYPSDLTVAADEHVQLTVMTFDDHGDVVLPPYFWEIHWTVQIVDNGVWKEKYYGGYNTTMVFRYDDSESQYKLEWADGLWANLIECADAECVSSRGAPSAPLFFSSMVGDVTGPTSTTTNSTSDPYLATSWFIADKHNPLALYGFGMPSCNPSIGGTAETFASSCILCLPDGEYSYRSTGAYDEQAVSLLSTFCGVETAPQHELHFVVENSECIPLAVREVSEICYPSLVTPDPSFYPTSIPIADPTI